MFIKNKTQVKSNLIKSLQQIYLMIYQILFTFLCLIGCLEAIDILVPEVIAVYPHDPSAFTQGLAIQGDYLYESTGLYGQSSLRKINLITGKTEALIKLPVSYFAEGIAIIDNQVVQLTWKENRAFIYDAGTLKLKMTWRYQGEGWGLCSDGEHLFMSDGTHSVLQREPFSFKIKKEIKIDHYNKKKLFLNDLEIVGDQIYANIWLTDNIVCFNKITGKVTGLIDASQLLTSLEKQKLGEEHVLNGIAYHSGRRTFFLTGKGWPWLFEVIFKIKNSE